MYNNHYAIKVSSNTIHSHSLGQGEQITVLAIFSA